MKKVSIYRFFVLNIIHNMIANFAHPITPTFIQDLHLSDYMFGVAFSCMALANFLFSPFWGKISKKIGPARIMTYSFFGYAFGQWLFMISTTEIGIGLARFIAGVFTGCIAVNQMLYIIVNSKENKSKNLAVMATIIAVSSPFGFLIGGLIGDYSIRMTFIVQIIGLVMMGVLFLLFMDDDVVIGELNVKQTLIESNPFRAFKDASKLLNIFFVAFFAVVMLTSFASTAYDQSFNYYIKDQFGFLPSHNGILKAVVGFITLIANSTICLWLLNKTRIIKSIISVLTICAIMMIGIIFVDNSGAFIIINVVFFGFNAVYLPMLQSIMSSISKNNGVLVGFYNSMRSVGMVIGSLIAGLVYSIHPKMAFVLALFAFAGSIILSIYNMKSVDRYPDINL
ncbi:MAG: MFS transporter [Erysipelotrichaceae bacterium]